MNKVLFTFAVITSYVRGDAFTPVATTPSGRIRGSIGLTVSNKAYFSFEGVPYARPPVGQLRFEPPEPVGEWVGEVEALAPTQCIQYNYFSEYVNGTYQVEGEEDCLHLNIYTRDLSVDANVDVLVHIHGGAFMFGSGTAYGPQIIMDRDVVYVSFNYRLGALGFLSTEDATTPGNNGLRDQIAALRWIRENIRYFGGDPDSVTISGMSAGGASVHLHYLMPGSAGLFKGGVSQSGCALNPWVLMERPLEKARQLADRLGCPADTSAIIKECLKTRLAADIAGAARLLQPWMYNPFSPFGVVVDAWAEDPVLPHHPYDLLVRGLVQNHPWIVSYTSSEGLFPASEFYADERLLADIDANWNDIMPHVLHYNCTVAPELRDEVSQAIRERYLGGDPVDRRSFSKLVELIGDRLFVVDIERATALHSSSVTSDVYSYLFDYRGAASKSDARTGSSIDIGVSHGDDTIYVMKTVADTRSNDDDRAMSEILTDMFVTFMQTGVPQVGVEWLPVGKGCDVPLRRLNISGPQALGMEEVAPGRGAFWERLPLAENDRLVRRSKDEL
ncbi:carboxylic ester hydrolase-like [Cylas formicarius]|uniref:carboxylic ester hydrolase-like n=1 Tax=Cylas formicarius TaxID=197179 RepID=UPI0029584155|nr:carboxylic ester hydrolase-like [Cylas formicarius]